MKSTTQKFSLSILYLFVFIFALSNSVKAQFWTENFIPVNTQPGAVANGYAGVNGTWTETVLPGNTGADANKFFISCTEAGMQTGNCGAGCPGGPQPPPTPFIGQSLHLGNVASFWAALCPAGDCGAVYSAGDGGLGFSDATTEVRAESPVINCTGNINIILTFNYLEFGDFSNDNGEVWYFDGVTWSLLLDMAKTDCGDGLGGPCNIMPCGNFLQGIWTPSPSIALPASADNNPNVKIGFRWVNDNDGVGVDPSLAVTKIQLTSPASANTITAGNLVGPFCAGATATLPFSSTGTFTAGNVYTAQLSDAAGSFASPVSLGTFPSTANLGNISLTIPANTPTGAGYMIQIVSNAPNATSNAIGPFTITASAPLSVTVAANPGTSICPGQCVTFTATPTNGGTAPTYQWQVNGVNGTSPSTNDTYTDCALQNGDQVTVIVTSNLACVTNSPATSTASVITYVSSQPFSVSLTPAGPITICAGDPIQLTANTVNGGTPPTYAWTVNGTTLPGVTTQTLSYNGVPVPIVDGTEVCVIATSSLVGCVTNSPDTACTIINVISNASPTAIISADTNMICVGGTINFTSTITNGGANPTYQWYVGSTPVPLPAGAASTFTSSTLAPGDVVSLVLTSNSTCATTLIDTSNTISVGVLPFLTPTIAIAPNSGICPGQPITFTSTQTGGGSSPQYFWYLNEIILLGTTEDLTINSSVFATGDTLTAVMVSNYLCLLTDTVTSNPYQVQLLSPATLEIGPNVSITYGESYKMDPEINGVVGAGTYLWTPDSTLSCNTCFNPIATPTITSEYVLTYKNPTGCIARDTILVDVNPNYDVFIPSGFSPNADNINDVFYIRGPYLKGVTMKIWDRIGGVVFESSYIAYGWDGTKNFKDVNTGIYVYYITVEFFDGVIKEFKGNITLSR